MRGLGLPRAHPHSQPVKLPTQRGLGGSRSPLTGPMAAGRWGRGEACSLLRD